MFVQSQRVCVCVCVRSVWINRIVPTIVWTILYFRSENVAPEKFQNALLFNIHWCAYLFAGNTFYFPIHSFLFSLFFFCFCCHNTITYIQIPICVNYNYLFFCAVTRYSCFIPQNCLFIYLFWMRQCQHVLYYIALVFHERIWFSYLVWLIVVRAINTWKNFHKIWNLFGAVPLLFETVFIIRFFFLFIFLHVANTQWNVHFIAQLNCSLHNCIFALFENWVTIRSL